jgi:hypothetical protein
MAYHYSDITTLVCSGGTLTFNELTGDTYAIDPARSSGLDMPRVRAPIDNKGQTDGYILHDFFKEGRHVVLGGVLVVRSSGTEAGYLSARDALLDDLVAKLSTALTATAALNFGTGSPLTVKCDVGAEFSGAVQKSFVFGLVSAT